MRKLLVAFAFLACAPLFWQPLRGQSPRVRVNSGHDKKQAPELTAPQAKPDQRGTKDVPFVIDTEGHQDGPAEAAKKRREKDDRDFRERWTFYSTVAVAGFTAVLMIVGIGGVCAAIRTLRAVEKQGIFMESQTRPWIGLDSPDGVRSTPLVIKNNIAFVTIVLRPKNFGSYPGQSVWSAANLIVTNNMTVVHAAADQIWQASIPQKVGGTVFPGPGTVSWEWPSSAAIDSDDEMLAFIVGCIWYLDQFGQKQHTVSIHRLQVPDTIQGVVFRRSQVSPIVGNWVETGGFVGSGPKQ